MTDPSADVLSLLEAALRVPAHETQASRDARAAIEARNARVNNAPELDWQPPQDPEGYARIYIVDNEDNRKARGFTSSVCGISLEAADGSVVRIARLSAGIPAWLPVKYCETEPMFGPDNRDLRALYSRGFLVFEAAGYGGKHAPLRHLSAYRMGLWTARAFAVAFENGREPPRLETAAAVADIKKAAQLNAARLRIISMRDEQAEVARILTNLSHGQRDLTARDRSVLYPNKSDGGAIGSGARPDFQATSALVES